MNWNKVWGSKARSLLSLQIYYTGPFCMYRGIGLVRRDINKYLRVKQKIAIIIP